MDKAIIEKVCKQVYRQFPFVRGQEPKITRQSDQRYLLVFSGSGQTPDGQNIHQKVRVTITQDGKIIKTSMSR
jgi:hypothetical protein